MKKKPKDLEDELWHIGYEIIEILEPICGIHGVMADFYLASISDYEYEDVRVWEKIIQAVDKKYKTHIFEHLGFYVHEPIIMMAMAIHVERSRMK